MTRRGLGVLCGLCLLVPSLAALEPDILRSAGAMPAPIAGKLRAAGIVAPNSLFFSRNGRVVVTPGLYEFPVQ